MTLESAWIYEIHHFPLKFVSIYCKKIKIMAITYFLATLPILATKIVGGWRRGMETEEENGGGKRGVRGTVRYNSYLCLLTNVLVMEQAYTLGIN